MKKVQTEVMTKYFPTKCHVNDQRQTGITDTFLMVIAGDMIQQKFSG